MDSSFEEVFFFRDDSSALTVYGVFRDALLTRWPQCVIKCSKTQISFTDGVDFAFASYPPRKLLGAVLISLGLRAPLNNPRVFAQSEPYPQRWTVHIIVHSVEEVDAELLDWLDDAHEYAVERLARRRRKL